MTTAPELEVHWVSADWQPSRPPAEWLTPEELTRWLKAGVHRDAFLRKRWLLRRCLDHRPEAGPLSLEQVCSACGRAGHGPVRVRWDTEGWVAVSMSAHEDLAAAVCASGLVGVDVVVAGDAAEPALDTALTPRERDAVRRSAHPALEQARLWARKEAALKAVGTGLRIEPRAVDVLSGWVTVVGVRLGLTDAVVPGRRAVVAVAHDGPIPAIVWRGYGGDGDGSD